MAAAIAPRGRIPEWENPDVTEPSAPTRVPGANPVGLAAGAGESTVGARVGGTALRVAQRALDRRVLNAINRFAMVPQYRLGLGWLFGSPLSGWVMVLRTRGRRSGLVRHAPVEYAVVGGRLYCLASFGERTAWLLNLRADPWVEVILPSGGQWRGAPTR